MDRSDLLPRLAGWSNALLAVLAIVAGGLVGLLVAAPTLGIAETRALAMLSDLLLPVAAAAFLVTLSLFQPLAAMLIWLVLAPYSRHVGLDINLGAGIPDLSLTRLMTGWLLLLVIVQAVRGQRRLSRLGAVDVAYGLFIVAMFVSAPSSHWGGAVAVQAVFDAYVVPFVALYVARQLVRNLADLRWLAITSLVIGVALAFLVIREQITGEVLFYAKLSGAYSSSFRKVVSLMGNAAPMGVTTALTLPLPLMLLIQTIRAGDAFTSRKALTILALAAGLAFTAVGVFMTYNRASWLGMALTLLVFLVLRPGARRVLAPLLVAAAILAAVFWQSVVSSPAVTERLLEDNSVDYRTTAVDLGLQMARREPLFGVGYSNFGVEAARSYGWDPADRLNQWGAAHNSYLFMLVSGGLLAFVPYAGWIVLLAWEGVQQWRRLRAAPDRAAAAGYLDAMAAAAALFLTYFVASGTFDNAETYVMNLMFYVGIGAVWGVIEEYLGASSGQEDRLRQSTFSRR